MDVGPAESCVGCFCAEGVWPKAGAIITRPADINAAERISLFMGDSSVRLQGCDDVMNLLFPWRTIPHVMLNRDRQNMSPAKRDIFGP